MIWFDSKEKRFQFPIQRSTRKPTPLPEEYVTLLRGHITGDVVLPGDGEYDEARRVSNPVFDNYPSVIVFCEVEADVALCLQVARESGFSTVVRSGGHSTAGFSSLSDGIVINVSRMNDVCIADDQSYVWAGAGTDFRKLNAKLEIHGLHMPSGACPDVCVGGFMQGGGYGFTARIFGMNCDQVTEVEVMLADGQIVRASKTENRDLFWAIRGGTGSNFGVLLRVRFKLQKGHMFSGFSICWDMGARGGDKNAAHALAWLQEHFIQDGAVPDLGYQMIWGFEGPEGEPRKPYLLMRGMFQGSKLSLAQRLAPVLKQPGAELQALIDPMPYFELNKKLLTEPYDVPQFPPEQRTVPPEAKLSRILSRKLTAQDWLILVRHFLTSPNPYTTVAMEIYGGAINAVDPKENAFVHRNSYCDLFCDVFWLTADEQDPAEKFLADWEAAVEPFWDGSVYQNYPQAGDTQFAGRFWGDLYPQLVAVKRKYDPETVFRFPQGLGILLSESETATLDGLTDDIQVRGTP